MCDVSVVFLSCLFFLCGFSFVSVSASVSGFDSSGGMPCSEYGVSIWWGVQGKCFGWSCDWWFCGCGLDCVFWLFLCCSHELSGVSRGFIVASSWFASASRFGCVGFSCHEALSVLLEAVCEELWFIVVRRSSDCYSSFDVSSCLGVAIGCCVPWVVSGLLLALCGLAVLICVADDAHVCIDWVCFLRFVGVLIIAIVLSRCVILSFMEFRVVLGFSFA